MATRGYQFISQASETSEWSCNQDGCDQAGPWRLCDDVAGMVAKVHTSNTGHVTVVRYVTVTAYGPRTTTGAHGRANPTE